MLTNSTLSSLTILVFFVFFYIFFFLLQKVEVFPLYWKNLAKKRQIFLTKHNWCFLISGKSRTGISGPSHFSLFSRAQEFVRSVLANSQRAPGRSFATLWCAHWLITVNIVLRIRNHCNAAPHSVWCMVNFYSLPSFV